MTATYDVHDISREAMLSLNAGAEEFIAMMQAVGWPKAGTEAARVLDETRVVRALRFAAIDRDERELALDYGWALNRLYETLMLAAAA